MSNEQQTPLVSVIMPVYNAGHFLGPAIESILNQTFGNFELLIVDDCSQDTSREVAQGYGHDPRVRVLPMPHNRGRAYCDNYASGLARGKYIAKMDADDVAMPQRLQTQVDFLEQNPAVDLTGSFLQCIGESRMVYTYPTTAEQVRSALLFDMPVGNPSVFFRRSILQEYGLGYDETLNQTEDYDFIARAAQHITIVNQPAVLMYYRTQSAQVKGQIHAERLLQANRIRERLLRSVGLSFSERELLLHNTISSYPFTLGSFSLTEVHAWLWKLYVHMQARSAAGAATMLKCVAERWFLACYNNCSRAVRGFEEFRHFPLGREYPLVAKQRLKFWLKDVLARYASQPTPVMARTQAAKTKARSRVELAEA